MLTTKEHIQQIYRLVLGREPDTAADEYWLPRIREHDITPRQFMEIVLKSDEYRDRHLGEVLTSEQFQGLMTAAEQALAGLGASARALGQVEVEDPKRGDVACDNPSAFAPSAHPTKDNTVIDVRDRKFWTRYIPSWDKRSRSKESLLLHPLPSELPTPLPFSEIAFQQYITDRGAVVRSMLDSFELALIYAQHFRRHPLGVANQLC